MGRRLAHIEDRLPLQMMRTDLIRRHAVPSSNNRGLSAPAWSRIRRVNCSICHVQTYKLSQGEPRRIFVGGAANVLDSQRYLRFLVDCAASSGFETDAVLK